MMNNREEMISIIMPVYNTESFLPQCLDSILSSTYQNFEIICVNDGSTDGSLNVLKQYADRDIRIEILDTKENKGQAVARNMGLDAAKGKYISFVDSDDFVSATFLSRLYELLKRESSEVAVCGFWETDEYSENKKEETIKTKKSPLTEKEWWKLYKHKHTIIMNCLWNKLYKAECFENHRFIPGIIYEDTNIQHSLLQDKMISVTAEKLYFYRRRASSTTTSKHSEKSLSRIHSLLERVEYFEKKKYYRAKTNTLQDTIKFLYQVIYNSNLCENEADEIYLSIRTKIKSLMTMRDWLMIRQKIQCWLIMYSIKIYHSIREISNR